MIRLLNKSIHHNFTTSKDKKAFKSLVDFTQRGQFRSPIDLKIGDKINNFQVTHCYKLPDYQINSVVLKCLNYGTQWIHFDCQEQNNSFAMTTKCQSAPLLAKMSLQKMLQCGSKKFPVCNPIQHMMRRSFNPQNFSVTTGDYILYGYQTSLLKDHYNLMEVFLNMMYNPLLRQEDFKNVVWRFELNNGKSLQITGELANQLRNMQNLSEIKLFDAIEKHLLGKQGFNSIEQISKFSYKNLCDWHEKIFNPKNLLIISHGDLHPINLVKKFTQTTEKFNWPEKFKLNAKKSDSQQSKENFLFEQSKTVFIQHFDRKVPFVLSFKLQNLSTQERILLSILSMIIFDMPNSVMMKWLSPQTPYPKHYGFQGNYFNIGVNLELSEKRFEQRQFIDLQKIIRDQLQQLCLKKISNFQIEQCLMQLESEYYSQDGMKLINGCLDNLIEGGPQSIPESLNVKLFISNILKRYRKENIFQSLLKKFILENKKYIRICGKYNEHLIEDSQLKQTIKLREVLNKLKQNDLKDINSYRPASILQDYRILPKIDVSQFQIFQEKNPLIFQINGIPVFHKDKCDGIKITMKYDITDIDQHEVKLIPVVCASYPWMGAKGLPTQTFNNYVHLYIRKMDMKFQTVRTPQGMKLYLFFSIEFSDRNAEFGFNLLKNLINQHNDKNYEMLSETIQKKASQNYNALSENLIQIHGMHAGASRSPYAMMEDPLFMSRSICSLASDIQKISNSKQILEQIVFQMKNILDKLKIKNRVEVLVQCRKSSLERHQKYVQTFLNALKQSDRKLEHINDKGYRPSPYLKYFPNYQQQFVFEAFSIPYYTNLQQAPASLVLSTIISENIKRYNPDGGSFAFKGSLISYLRGSRKKVLELEQYYKKIQDIQEAKRIIFHKFRRYTAADQFYSGLKAQQARIFKQSIALVDQADVQTCLQKYILSTIKEGKSSILSIGPNLGSYEPLIKKGWIVERSIEDMSLNMESASPAIPHIETSKYINIY